MNSWEELIFGNQTGFQPFSIEHIIPVLVFIAATFLWIRLAQSWNATAQYQSLFVFSLTLAFAVLWWMFYRIYIGQFDIKEDLPFHLCNILTLIFPFALYYRSRSLFAILYFYILAGTLQAVITPDLKQPFPHYMYFRYWWIHCGMISMILYTIAIFRWKIYFKDLRNAFIGANVYLLFSLIINYFTGGNYFFTMRKPDAFTVLDYMGPWPWYLITAQFVMLGSFLLYYLPVWYWQNAQRSINSE